MSSGSIFGLPFNAEEIKELDEKAKQVCLKRNLIPNKINLLNVKTDIVKKNLHIVFAMSPLSKEFSHRLRMFPSLINNCSLNWMGEWPEEALTGVAN